MNICFLPSVLSPTVYQNYSVNDILTGIANQRFKGKIDALPDSTISPEKYKSEKLKLPAIAFNGSFTDKVDNAHFSESSGLFHFDIDNLINGNLAKTRQNLIDNCPNLYAVWLSPSGNGLKGLLRIPDDLIHNDADFKKAYSQIEPYFLGLGITIDKSCKDVRRLCFVCSDPDIYINTNAPAFILDMSDKAPKPTQQPTTQNNTAKKYIDRCCNLIFNSTKGNHHDARLRAGKLAGGYVAAGLVNEFEVLAALERASRMISAQYSDSEATVLKEFKSLSNALENGKLSPCEPDRQQTATTATSMPPKPTVAESEIEGLIWSNGDDLAKTAVAPKFLINDIINTDAHGILYANSGAYKTFMTLAMAHSICTGLPFMGKYEVFTTGKVLYICGEGKGSISRRIKAAQIAVSDFNDNLMILESRINIDNIAHMVQLQALIEKERPVFVIFDTFSSLTAGTDENSNTEVAHTLKMINDACSNGTTSSMIIHHTGKNAAAGSRGASAFKNNTDFEFSMIRAIDAKETTLTCKKMKDGDDFEEIVASAHVVELGIIKQDGRMATSLILKPCTHDFTSEPKEQGLTKRQYDILTELHNAMDCYGEPPNLPLVTFFEQNDMSVPIEVVHVDPWRELAYKKIGQNQNANKTAFRDARLKLESLGKVGTHDGFYWIV